MTIFLNLLGIAITLFFLVKSADLFVTNSANVARTLGMSPLLIGMIIIGFGTSAPEMLVSAQSAISNAPDIALGNAYGSNIANIGLILGLTALLAPITATRSVITRELPILIIITILSLILAISNNNISRLDSIILLSIFILSLTLSTIKEKKLSPTQEENKSPTQPLPKSLLLLLTGLILLIISSHYLVIFAVKIAQLLGVPDLIIGLTIVAVGTSLPELASSLSAIKKGEHDLALGNIVGSNLFNTLAVVGIAGIIKPIPASTEIIYRDLPTTLLLTSLLFIFLLPYKKHSTLSRLKGAILLLSYISYILFLIKT